MYPECKAVIRVHIINSARTLKKFRVLSTCKFNLLSLKNFFVPIHTKLHSELSYY